MFIKATFTEEMKYIKCSVTKRKDGRFYCRIPIGYELKENSQKLYQYKNIYGIDENDVYIKRAGFIDEQIREQQEKQLTKELFTTKLHEWVYNVKFNSVKPTTFDRIEDTYKYQILTALKELDLEKIRLIDVTEKHIKDIMDANLYKGYAYSTLLKVKIRLKEFFDYYEDELVKNPMRKYKFYKKENVIRIQNSLKEEQKIAKDKITKMRKELKVYGFSDIEVTEKEKALYRVTLKSQINQDDIHYFSDEEIEKIKYTIENGYYKSYKHHLSEKIITHGPYFISQAKVFLFMLNTGLRCGEMVALKYSDVCFEKNSINIDRASIGYKERNQDGSETGKFVTGLSSPKTPTSKAIIKVSPYAVQILKEMLSEEPKGYQDFIVHDEHHKPINSNALGKRFSNLLSGAGVSKCGTHSLRHTCATQMYKQSAYNIKFVANKIRHKDAAFTANTYIHNDEAENNEILNKFKV